MRISSVRAAAVRDPTPLGRSSSPHDEFEAEHMNPMVSSGSRRGVATRFAPPWDEAICVLTADDGTWGVGLTAHAGVVVPLINDYLGPLLEGEVIESVDDIAELWDLMATVTAGHLGTAGVTSYAISAVDLAMYDALGKRLVAPVFELLGGAAHGAIECYATGADVRKLADLGFERFKVPCPWIEPGRPGVAAAVAAVEQAREVVGSDDLMVDGWAVMDVGEAAALCRALEPFDLRFVEDIVHPDDTSGYQRLRSATSVRLAAGERWFTPRPFEREAAAGTIDVLQPDALWVGGVTATVRIAEAARRHRAELAIHCGVNDAFGQHLCLALAENVLGEMYIGPSPTVAGAYRSTPGMAVPRDGRVRPSDAPGFGVELSLAGIEAAT